MSAGSLRHPPSAPRLPGRLPGVDALTTEPRPDRAVAVVDLELVSRAMTRHRHPSRNDSGAGLGLAECVRSPAVPTGAVSGLRNQDAARADDEVVPAHRASGGRGARRRPIRGRATPVSASGDASPWLDHIIRPRDAGRRSRGLLAFEPDRKRLSELPRLLPIDLEAAARRRGRSTTMPPSRHRQRPAAGANWARRRLASRRRRQRRANVRGFSSASVRASDRAGGGRRGVGRAFGFRRDHLDDLAAPETEETTPLERPRVKDGGVLTEIRLDGLEGFGQRECSKGLESHGVALLALPDAVDGFPPT